MERVLIVGSDGAARAALRSTLETEGFQVIAEETGAAGLDAGRAQDVDVIILDLPGINDLDTLTAMVRAVPDVPIVAVAGHGWEESILPGKHLLIRAVDLGAQAALSKPFKTAALLSAVWMSLARFTGAVPASRGADWGARPATEDAEGWPQPLGMPSAVSALMPAGPHRALGLAA